MPSTGNKWKNAVPSRRARGQDPSTYRSEVPVEEWPALWHKAQDEESKALLDQYKLLVPVPVELGEGACQGISKDEADFIPKHVTKANTAACKAVCARCEVQMECLDFAIDAGEEFFVWGGMTPEERKMEAKMRRSS